jgi:hypothetical protein
MAFLASLIKNLFAKSKKGEPTLQQVEHCRQEYEAEAYLNSH